MSLKCRCCGREYPERDDLSEAEADSFHALREVTIDREIASQAAVAHVGKRLKLQPGQVRRIFQRLDRAGYVSRHVDGDGKLVTLVKVSDS